MSCGPVEAPYTLPPRALCAGSYEGLPEVLGHLGDVALREVSGIVPSPTTSELLWMHNDSGDAAVLYALSTDGQARGRVQLPFTPVDVEDIAVASCPDRRGPCVWLADTGNNSGDRTDQSIYFFPEPVPNNAGILPDVESVQRIDLGHAQGFPNSIDVEAMVVLPDASALLLIEKVDAAEARVFAVRAPFPVTASPADDDARDEDRAVVTEIARVRTESPAGVDFARMITGADLHPSGRALVVRTYAGIFEVRFSEKSSALDLADGLIPTVTFGPFSEPQGEAIAYDASGTGILTVSEANGRAAADVAIHRFSCR